MDDFLIAFVNQYGLQIAYAFLTVVAGAIGTWIGKVYKAKVNDETKRKVVKTCCTAVEQIYKDLDGETKYKKACEGISAMLAEKSITITALEMQMLIEEVCFDFAHSAKTEIDNPELIEDSYEY